MPTLAELPGLASAKRFAAKIALDPPIHAILLYGSGSASVEELAEWLAMTWLCKNPTIEGPCGDCQVCGAFGRRALADFVEITPLSSQNQILSGAIVEGAKEQGTVPISVFSRSMPLIARSKVVSIQSCERLNSTAANAFLKMLEEPPPYMRYILTTNAIGSVLPTIRSRCVTVCCESPVLQGDSLQSLVMYELPWSRDLPLEVLTGFCDLADQTRSSPPMMALKLAEEFRALTEKISVSNDAARHKYARALELFGTILGLKDDNYRRYGGDIAEVHRRILGNCHSGYALDDLFVRLLAE
jgi:hypothetical protein